MLVSGRGVVYGSRVVTGRRVSTPRDDVAATVGAVTSGQLFLMSGEKRLCVTRVVSSARAVVLRGTAAVETCETMSK